ELLALIRSGLVRYCIRLPRSARDLLRRVGLIQSVSNASNAQPRVVGLDHRYQFQLVDESGIRTNAPRRLAVMAVGEFGRSENLPFGAEFHFLKSGLPAFESAARPSGIVFLMVKFCPIQKRGTIRDGNELVRIR